MKLTRLAIISRAIAEIRVIRKMGAIQSRKVWHGLAESKITTKSSNLSPRDATRFKIDRARQTSGGSIFHLN